MDVSPGRLNMLHHTPAKSMWGQHKLDMVSHENMEYGGDAELSAMSGRNWRGGSQGWIYQYVAHVCIGLSEILESLF